MFARGIPFVSKDRTARMKAIAEELASGKYDIVCLQEVWTVSDFNLIRDGVKSSLPYSHYFHRYGLGIQSMANDRFIVTH